MTRNPRPPEAGVNRVYGNLAQALSRPMLNEVPVPIAAPTSRTRIACDRSTGYP